MKPKQVQKPILKKEEPKKEEDEIITYFNNVETVEKPKPKAPIKTEDDLFAVDITKFRAAQAIKDDDDDMMFKPTK